MNARARRGQGGSAKECAGGVEAEWEAPIHHVAFYAILGRKSRYFLGKGGWRLRSDVAAARDAGLETTPDPWLPPPLRNDSRPLCSPDALLPALRNDSRPLCSALCSAPFPRPLCSVAASPISSRRHIPLRICGGENGRAGRSRNKTMQRRSKIILTLLIAALVLFAIALSVFTGRDDGRFKAITGVPLPPDGHDFHHATKSGLDGTETWMALRTSNSSFISADGANGNDHQRAAVRAIPEGARLVFTA